MGTVRGDKRKLRNDRDRAERAMVELLAADPDAVYAAAVEALARFSPPPVSWVEIDDPAEMTWGAWLEETHGYPVLVARGPFTVAMAAARSFDRFADKRYTPLERYDPRLRRIPLRRSEPVSDEYYERLEKRLEKQ